MPVKRRLAGGVLALVALASASIVRTQDATISYAAIEPLVNDAIARHELPGAVIVIGRGDEIVYRRAFGQRAVEPSAEPMTDDTIFDLASLTKVVATTTSVMQLVEQGRIRLRDPVTQFIPDFGSHDKNRITILHLLTHTSGLPPDLPLEVEFSGADEAIRRAGDL